MHFLTRPPLTQYNNMYNINMCSVNLTTEELRYLKVCNHYAYKHSHIIYIY